MQLQGTYVNVLSKTYGSGGCHCTVSIAVYTTGVIHAILSILQGHRQLLRSGGGLSLYRIEFVAQPPPPPACTLVMQHSPQDFGSSGPWGPGPSVSGPVSIVSHLELAMPLYCKVTLTTIDFGLPSCNMLICIN